MSIQSRVWSAMRGLQSQRIPLDGFVIHMSPEVLAHLKMEVNPSFPLTFHEIDRFMGLPVEPDKGLAKGEIVLRYEVKA